VDLRIAVDTCGDRTQASYEWQMWLDFHLTAYRFEGIEHRPAIGYEWWNRPELTSFTTDTVWKHQEIREAGGGAPELIAPADMNHKNIVLVSDWLKTVMGPGDTAETPLRSDALRWYASNYSLTGGMGLAVSGEAGVTADQIKTLAGYT
jgi:hypothetical protein